MAPLLVFCVACIGDLVEVESASGIETLVERTESSDGLGELFDEYPRMVGWLRIDGTKINYPVMQAEDNVWFLSRAYDGEYSGAGSLFVDYRNNAFDDDFMVIYGHRMSGENMFSEVVKFSDEEFLRRNNFGILQTRNGMLKLWFYAYAEVETSMSEIYELGAFRNGENDRILAAVNEKIVARSGLDLSARDKIIVLSTCDRSRRNYRNILIAKIEKV